MQTKHVVMFSTGAGSAWLAKYVVDKYGKENTIVLITDTKWEDEDNYRFMKEVAEYIGVEITEKSDGRTPEDIFRKDLYFGNFGTAPCSKELKMKQTFLYIQELIEDGIMPILYFGIDYKEARRAPRLAYNYKHNVDVFEDGVELRFPLIAEIDGQPVSGKQLIHNRDFLNSEKMPKVYNKEIYESLDEQNAVISIANPKLEIENEWGIKLPRMYTAVEQEVKNNPDNIKAKELLDKGVKGYSHANCFSGDTRFITSEGVKTFIETVGTKVKVLGHDANWKDAEIKNFGKQTIVELTISRNGKTKVIETTNEHRWFKRKSNKEYIEVFTQDLKEGDKLQSMYINSNTSVSDWEVISVKETNRTEDVYCVVVPEGHAFTLEDNIFTGNCGGICVKGGMGHYSVLYATWKDRYLYMENLEKEINDAQIAKNGRRYTILSRLEPTGEFDEKGKEKKKKVPYSLEEYRLEVLEGDINSKVEVEENTVSCECVF